MARCGGRPEAAPDKASGQFSGKSR
jgi:hypothetical protein